MRKRLMLIVLGLAIEALSGVAGWSEEIALGNPYLQVVVSPELGGRISSLRVSQGDQEWVRPEIHPGWGLALDHFVSQPWPGELLEMPYRVGERGSDFVVLEVEVTGKWGNTTNSELTGLVLRKRIRVAPDWPVVEVEITISNPTTGVKRFELWGQQVPRPSAEVSEQIYLRPTTRGVQALRYPDDQAVARFASDPTAGWCGVFAQDKQAGLLFLLDYNEVRTLYSALSAGTCEWMYDPIVLPPGEAWKTEYQIRPVWGLPSVTFASPETILYLEPLSTGEQLSFAAWATAGTKPANSHSLVLTAEDGQGDKSTGEVQLPKLGSEPVEVGEALSLAAGEAYVLRGKLESEAGSQEFATIHRPPDLPVSEDPFAEYRLAQPPKTPQFLKPASIRLLRAEEKRTLALEGLFHDVFGVDRALAAAGLETRRGLFWVDHFGPHLTYFPATYEELLKYRLVVLADIDARALNPRSQEMVADFVKVGGGLLILGGYYAYGNGGYADSRLAEVLPVDCGPPFDFVDFAKSQPMILEKIPPGLQLPSWLRELPGGPRMHRLGARPGATVVLHCGDWPALVTWQVGKGRVAAFAGTVLGHYQRSGPVFWESREWRRLLPAVMKWLAEGGAEASEEERE